MLTTTFPFNLAAWAVTSLLRSSSVDQPWSPVMGGVDFPDPSVIETDRGWYAFSTESTINDTYVHVPQAFSANFRSWEFLGAKDAMPTLAPWIDVTNAKVWAPDVVALSDGRFILYYTALSKVHNTHCLGYAISHSIEGPYADQSIEPWICPVAEGGAIDPAGYVDSDGSFWVLYKVDGNSIGHGGSCNNGVQPIVPTPIMLQQVKPDGHSLVGPPTTILTNGPDDGPYIEAPSLVKMEDNYVLFFSSHCYTSDEYDTKYAFATDIHGPYVRKGELLKTNQHLNAPGGLDVSLNGKVAVFHANWKEGRAMYTARLERVDDRIIAEAQSIIHFN